jgi:hypothetical protein
MKKTILFCVLLSGSLFNCSNKQNKVQNETTVSITDSTESNENRYFAELFKSLSSDPIEEHFLRESELNKKKCSIYDFFKEQQSLCSDTLFEAKWSVEEEIQLIKYSPLKSNIEFYSYKSNDRFKCFILPDVGYLIIDLENNLSFFISPPSEDHNGMSSKSIGVIYFLDNNTLLPYMSIKTKPDKKLFLEKYAYSESGDNDFYGHTTVIEYEDFYKLKYSDLVDIKNKYKDAKLTQEIFLWGKASFRHFPLWTFSECINCFQPINK